MSRIGKAVETESVVVNCQELGGRGRCGMIANGSGVSFGIMKMFWNYIVVVVAQPCEYTKNL